MDSVGGRVKTVAVIGGGMAGCAVALGLQAIGLDVTVYEAADTVRREGESISLLANGTAALAALGLTGPFGQRISRLRFLARRSDRPVTVVDTAEIERKTGYPYVVIPRAEMLELLVGTLRAPIVCGKRCQSVSTKASGVEIHFADGTTEVADLAVAADGTRSVVRETVWPEDRSRRFSTAWQGTVEQPQNYPGPDQVMLWNAPGMTAGTFPTTGSRVAFFIERRAGLPSRDGLDDKASLVDYFAGWSGPLVGILEAVGADGVRRDEVYLRRPPKQWAKGRVFVAGDAAHTLSPSSGQGTNQAFEDAVALAVALSDHPDAEAAGLAYSRARYRRASTFWRLAKLTTDPVMARLNQLNGRVLPSSAATAGWLRITQPCAPVRQVLSAGGL